MYEIKTYKCNDCPNKWMASDPKKCPSCQSKNLEVLHVKKTYIPSSRSLAILIFFAFIAIVIITFKNNDDAFTEHDPNVFELEIIKKNNHAFAYKIKLEKAYLYLTDNITKTARYLLEGDDCLCGESKILNSDKGAESFLFCWFKHPGTGKITSGYVQQSKMNFKTQTKENERYFSLSNLYSANEKVFFQNPETFKKTAFAFSENEFTICDGKIVTFQNEDYQYCGFKNGSNQMNSGYIKTSDLKNY